MSAEELESEIQKELTLQLQLDKMTKQAFGNKVLAPKKLTRESEEAIKEYNKQFKIVEFEKDEHGEPILDDLGKPIKKKNIPLPPDLEPEPLVQEVYFDGEYFGLPELGVLEGKAGIEILKNQVEVEKEQLVILKKDKQKVLDLINGADTSTKNGREKVTRLMSYITKIEKKIKEVGKKLEQIATNNDNYLYLDEVYIQAKAEDEAILQGVENINKKKMDSYKETLKALNSGAMNMDKAFGETEEDYLIRLKANAEIDIPDQSEFEAIEYAKRKFKENMKELFRSESLIESVANQLKIGGHEIEYKTEINKKFPTFKRQFIETFGKNNKSIIAGDVIEFIHNFISGDPKIFKEIQKIVKKEEEPQVIKAPEESVFTIINPLNNKKVYFMPAEDEDGYMLLLWSMSLTRNSFKEIATSKNFKEIQEVSGLKKTDILQKIPGKSPSFMSHNLIDKFGIIPMTFTSDEPIWAEYDEETQQELHGWGIEPEKIPEIVPFGKLKLHLNKLYYKNNLVVKHKDNSNIIGFPNLIVSDDFVKLIMKLLKGEDIKQKDLNSLKTMELHLYNRLIVLAELHKKHPIESDKTIEHLKHQLELLTGEIAAGNDNKDLVKQLHQVVHSLKNFGAITSIAATSFIKQYK